jgi:hypothetical protein
MSNEERLLLSLSDAEQETLSAPLGKLNPSSQILDATGLYIF